MPTYTYRCDSGGHQFDVVQRFSDDPLRECPQCGGAVRRVIQPVGVVFKGSGWYITDSRSKPTDDAKPAEAKAEKADKPAEEKKPGGEQKPAAEAAKPAEKAPASAASKAAD